MPWIRDTSINQRLLVMKQTSWRIRCSLLATGLLICSDLLFAQAAATSAAATTRVKVDTPTKKPDVIFVPTRQEIVDKMLQMAELKTNDILYDLGCGDGRIVVTAAKKYGVRAVGVDIDPQRVKESLDNV